MRNAMLSTPQSVKPRVAPETPYLKAKQEWDFRIGTSAVQAKNWRIACIGSLLLSGLLTGVIFFQASQSKVIPVVVGLDKDTGEAKTLGVVTKDAYSPGPLEIKYYEHGDRFIVEIRNKGMVRKARRILSRRMPNMIIAGRISKSSVRYNSMWSYHMVPKTIQFGELFMEVCDAAINHVEEHLNEVGGAFLPGMWWCPWSSKLRRELRR